MRRSAQKSLSSKKRNSIIRIINISNLDTDANYQLFEGKDMLEERKRLMQKKIQSHREILKKKHTSLLNARKMISDRHLYDLHTYEDTIKEILPFHFCSNPARYRHLKAKLLRELNLAAKNKMSESEYCLTSAEREELDQLESTSFFNWKKKNLVDFIKGCKIYGLREFQKISESMGKESFTANEIRRFSIEFWKKIESVEGGNGYFEYCLRTECEKEKLTFMKEYIKKHPELKLSESDDKLIRDSVETDLDFDLIAKNMNISEDLILNSKEGYRSIDIKRKFISILNRIPEIKKGVLEINDKFNLECSSYDVLNLAPFGTPKKKVCKQRVQKNAPLKESPTVEVLNSLPAEEASPKKSKDQDHSTQASSTSIEKTTQPENMAEPKRSPYSIKDYLLRIPSGEQGERKASKRSKVH